MGVFYLITFLKILIIMRTTSIASKLGLAVGAMLLVSSCVTKKNFNALTAEKEALAKEMKMMRSDFDSKIANLESGNADLTNKN